MSDQAAVNAATLRTMLDSWDRYKNEPAWTISGYATIADTFAESVRWRLSLLEGDEATVEKVARTIFTSWFKDDPGDWAMDEGHHVEFLGMARAVVAAITEGEA